MPLFLSPAAPVAAGSTGTMSAADLAAAVVAQIERPNGLLRLELVALQTIADLTNQVTNQQLQTLTRAGAADAIAATDAKIPTATTQLLTDTKAAAVDAKTAAGNVPAAILSNPANKLLVDATGKVTTGNPGVLAPTESAALIKLGGLALDATGKVTTANPATTTTGPTAADMWGYVPNNPAAGTAAGLLAAAKSSGDDAATRAAEARDAAVAAPAATVAKQQTVQGYKYRGQTVKGVGQLEALYVDPVTRSTSVGHINVALSANGGTLAQGAVLPGAPGTVPNTEFAIDQVI